jgi:hypothetical protein
MRLARGSSVPEHSTRLRLTIIDIPGIDIPGIDIPGGCDLSLEAADTRLASARNLV